MENIEIKKGDLLLGDCDVICHQVNTFGCMGAGIALSIKARFPASFAAYKKYCDSKARGDLIGSLIITQEVPYRIAHIFSQDDWKTDYGAMGRALAALRDYCEEKGLKTVGFPYLIGCGIAGGKEDRVLEVIKTAFGGSRLNVRIYSL